uniref:Uncharacterized protein n=1 Tax=Anguilla anguilla TaxID=7936 RepID=A0A0E9SY49_ANGAN
MLSMVSLQLLNSCKWFEKKNSMSSNISG